ncbi:hypothetical protein [Butyrivibrio sp. INlla21]|uniref:hypothetical protein n=1 Tax=Butyrivibrio sp. INlla21 TaxID=1520811 RepID=UPI0008E20A4D|nr:hypothetical protein [Butyrivibrio sp. INlla21]SFU36816.1 hypothetical protein SAMN02910342_00276 [Butyrivibrio sp. INlla21]
MVKTELWEMVERERRALDYIEYCETRRFLKKCTMFVAGMGLAFVILVLIN